MRAIIGVAMVAMVAILSACSSDNADQTSAAPANGANMDVASIASDGVLPNGAYILLGRMMPVMLEQCSRGAPPIGQSTWQPNAADIALLEAAIPAALADHAGANGEDYSQWPAGWQRQYVGIMRGSIRRIYGNFVPVSHDQSALALTDVTPIHVCDGGPAFFGVEFDTATRRFTHMAFNGQS